MRRRFNIHQRKDGRWYARYQKTERTKDSTGYGYVYGKTREEVEERLKEVVFDFYDTHQSSSLNLLILGAGTHGKDVKEIAQSLHIFKEIDFLDDHVVDESVLGKCDEVEKFRAKYPCAFVAIGDNKVRSEYSEYLKEHHFLIPSIVAPSAGISNNASIGDGSVIMPQANLGAVNVGDFCIIAAGCTIGSGVSLGKCVRVDSGAIIPKGSDVPDGTWIRSGEVYIQNGWNKQEVI